jgi:hypothetical protein
MHADNHRRACGEEEALPSVPGLRTEACLGLVHSRGLGEFL